MYKAIPSTRNEPRTTYWGIFFGIFPDILAFTPFWAYIFYNFLILRRKFEFVSPEDNGHIPWEGLTGSLYNLSHSLVVWAVIFIVVWLILKKIPWMLLGWALHIGIDIFSHSNQFFPTPFLWPVSKFHVNAVSWAGPVFMIVNYGALLLLYLFVVPRLKKLVS